MPRNETEGVGIADLEDIMARAQLKQTQALGDKIALKLSQFFLVFITFSETIYDATRKMGILLDANMRYRSTKDPKLIAWIFMVILQIGGLFVIQMLSCMVVFSSIDINSALNDSLGMLVLSALPAIGSKIYSWHI